MFVDTEKIVGVLGKEPPVMQKREALKIEKARDEWRKLISQDWRVNQEAHLKVYSEWIMTEDIKAAAKRDFEIKRNDITFI